MGFSTGYDTATALPQHSRENFPTNQMHPEHSDLMAYDTHVSSLASMNGFTIPFDTPGFEHNSVSLATGHGANGQYSINVDAPALQ